MAAVIPSSMKVSKGGAADRRVERRDRLGPAREYPGRCSRSAGRLHHYHQGISKHARYPVHEPPPGGRQPAIGTLRKRARGLPDTVRCKLESRQGALPDPPLGRYALTWKMARTA